MDIDILATLVVYLIALAISCLILFLVVKAAVARGIKDVLWNLEVSTRNAVKNGVLEAMQELEKSKTGDNHHG